MARAWLNASAMASSMVELGFGPTLSFYTAIGCPGMSFIRDLHANLAFIAVICCQSDSVVHG
jgi:hypothetical protein